MRCGTELKRKSVTRNYGGRNRNIYVDVYFLNSSGEVEEVSRTEERLHCLWPAVRVVSRRVSDWRGVEAVLDRVRILRI